MSASNLRVGVVGVGAIGQNHARVFAELPQADFTAIYDADLARAAEFAGRYGAKATIDLAEFVSLVDAATVATPTVTHREIAGFLLERGAHVLVEKPIAASTEEARELVDLARSRRRTLQVGHIERFNPVLRVLEEQLTRPRFIEAHRLSPFPQRSLDIGVVLDVMIHDLEIILHLVRSPIVSIDAVGVPVLTNREDIANARLRFENGCVANVTASRVSPERLRKIRVFEENCYLSLDYMAQEGKIHRKNGTSIEQAEVEVEKDEPLKLELTAFVDCAARGAEPAVSGQQGAAALDVALEITRLVGKS